MSVCVCPSVEGPIAPGPPPCPRKRSPRELGVLRTWSALRVHAQRALQTRARGLTAAPSVPLPGSASAPRARAEGGAPRPHYPGISRAERPGTTTCGNHSSRRRGSATGGAGAGRARTLVGGAGGGARAGGGWFRRGREGWLGGRGPGGCGLGLARRPGGAGGGGLVFATAKEGPVGLL